MGGRHQFYYDACQIATNPKRDFLCIDRWLSANLMASTYIWLPLTVSGTTASLPTNYLNWILNPSTGAGTAGPSETTNEGEAATLAGGAKTVSCAGCSGTSAAGYLGGSSGGTITFPNVYSSVATTTTIRVKNEVRSSMSFTYDGRLKYLRSRTAIQLNATHK